MLQKAVRALSPPPKETVSEYCAKNVNLVQGLTPKLEVSIAPHMRGPLNRIGDRSVKEMHWLWSPGGGKTTGLEGAIQWKMDRAPSNILVVGQKDDTAERWMETRMLPSIRKNPSLKDLLPSSGGKDRHKIRKTTVIFNNGFYLEAGGSAESNLQEKSMPMVIFEEAWKLSEHPGRIQQGKQRTHDKWDALILYVGQAGETHYDPDNEETFSDLYREWRKSNQAVFSFCCPECQTIQPFKWDQVKWDKVEIDGYGIDWDATSKTVRMVCANPDCGEEWHDTIKNRRMLADSAVDHPSTEDGYVVTNPNAERGFVGFQANALCYWRIPWTKLVQQFEEAMEAKFKGDLSLLQVFIMQRLCEFWTPQAYDERHELEEGGYKIEEFENGELIDGEEARGIAVDVQQSDLWYTIGAMAAGGHIQILDCGQALTFEEIEEKRKAYKVNRQCVLVDSQYRKDYVFQKCSQFGWTAYAGVFKEFFNIKIKDETVRVPYSKTQPVQAGNGKRTTLINLCVNPIKDVIAEIRAGRMGRLLVPDNVDPRFKDHLNAEVKRRMVAGRDNREVEMWVRIGKRDNHMLDNLMALVGLAMVKRLVEVGKVATPQHEYDDED